MGSWSHYEWTGLQDTQGDMLMTTDGIKFTEGQRCAQYTSVRETPVACVAPDGVSTLMLIEDADQKRMYPPPHHYSRTCCTKVVPDSEDEALAGMRRRLVGLYAYTPEVRGVLIFGTLTGIAVAVLLLLVLLALLVGRIFLIGPKGTEVKELK